MREVLPVHEPLLINTLGHAAGTWIFGIFLYFLLKGRPAAVWRQSRLTVFAALLAFLWNLASLMVIASGTGAPIGFSALSLLPAVLLHLALGARFPWIRATGYCLASLTVAMHCGEPLWNAGDIHDLALRVTSFGFGALTLVAVAGLVTRPEERRTLTPRLAGAMSMFLFALSFVHFGTSHQHSWSGELFAHHAGIVLALFVLLQDYRFLLLDAFVRFLANILFAALIVSAIIAAVGPEQIPGWSKDSPFRQGMLLVGACMLLLAFAELRSHLSRFLDHALFSRNNLDELLSELRAHAGASWNEQEFLEWAAIRIAHFFDAPPPGREFLGATLDPSLVSDLPPSERDRLLELEVEAVLPLRISTESIRYLLLGRRNGGRRYLSEDLAALHSIQAELAELVEQHRQIEMRRLVSQAELRALQAQIHPHFLFNAFNTLYGIIPREAHGARRTVLNLADIFRYFLQTQRTYIPLEEELRIVRAYLEIESMRLGGKLRTEIDVPPGALPLPIPILTIQPLVENAVKHGISSLPHGGTVRVHALQDSSGLRIRVSDSGAGFGAAGERAPGVGLENVVRRLQLCYGSGAGIEVDSSTDGTSVSFVVPLRSQEAVHQ